MSESPRIDAAAANEVIRGFLLSRAGRTLTPAEWAEYERLRGAYLAAVRGARQPAR